MGLPKGAPPTKIDITTGKGVPGGFDGGNVKLSDVENKRIMSNIDEITVQETKINNTILAINAGKIPPIPDIMDALNKLNDLKKKMSKKLNISTKVPDFSKVVVIPAAPPLSDVPDFQSMGIPDLPELPENSNILNTSNIV